MRSPVGLSRLRRPDMSHGQVMRLAAAAGGAVGGEPSQGVLGGRARLGVGGMVAPGGRQKDGVFFRPLPCMKARSGSWGGYDRRALMRRTRFDSIPEGLAEEEDDDLDQEVGFCFLSRSSCSVLWNSPQVVLPFVCVSDLLGQLLISRSK